MKLITRDPFQDISQFFDNSPFLTWQNGTADVDIYEEGNNIMAKINIPGFDKEQIKVDVDDNALHLLAKKEEQKEEKKKRYYHREISSGGIERWIPLPSKVAEDKIDAHYENGVLQLTMPKAGDNRERKLIAIK
ncbi:MAG: Hsp20/alpha crystallin family protein [Candidatus Abawacabacteria bacterium]|nr:Hsp20/alpha crystallin family protein [Candidatus Abawacabacteria bacterium]